jgi:hypothetical protein
MLTCACSENLLSAVVHTFACVRVAVICVRACVSVSEAAQAEHGQYASSQTGFKSCKLPGVRDYVAQ